MVGHDYGKKFVIVSDHLGVLNILPGEILATPDPLFIADRSGLKIAAEGLGVIAFYGQMWYGIEITVEYNAVMTGYKKGEETFGYLPSIDTLMSVGIPNRANQLNFSVYPNPASSVVQVVLPTSDFGQVRLLDISGRELFKMPINSEKVEIDTRKYPQGIYFIRVATQNGIGIKKIIISR